MEAKKFILGLDLGTNSIGWAIVEHDEGGQPSGLAACGARIFQEAVDLKTRTPKNQARRKARSARRVIARRRMRRDSVLKLLLSKSLLPEEPAEREKLFADNKSFDPYELRKRALDEKLEPYEFGRVMYHLTHRRGFQSNRKAGKEKEGEVNKGILSLRKEMEESGSRTLGEYLAGKPKKREHYTERAMYTEEFEEIWKCQQRYYPDLLDQALKVELHNAIFFQRPLKTQKNLVGKCTFEPTRKRAPRATLEYQRFRMLQDLNNLTIKNPKSREYRPLRKDEREKLLKRMEKQKSLSWGGARTALGLHEGEIFNLEEKKKNELIGDRTAYDLRKILGKNWDEMSSEQQDALITDMLTIDNMQGFLKRMTSHHGFDPEIAEKLAELELERGYSRLSHKAICNILPHLEKGLTYDKACSAAGYDHSRPVHHNTISDKLDEPTDLRNPVVQKALYETRKVVNAIIRRYGKPETIRIEMARDMKLTRKEKERVQKQQKTNQKNNEDAKEILCNEFSQFKERKPTRNDIIKYKLWKECKCICPYTGKTISQEMLFSPEVQVEHIIPYSRSLDDSYMNKTLCMAYENSKKHNKTPYEAYGADEGIYEGILQRVKGLPWPKRRRFEQKEVDTDGFIERKLNDTRYICTEVKSYLQQLGVNTEVSRGEATWDLRRRWDLNRILADDGTFEKNRKDHRHHAIDAVVIALTDRALFQKLSRLSGQYDCTLRDHGFRLEKPWPTFDEEVQEKIENMIVSHSPNRKISGALHDGTAYGYSNREGVFAYRKPLSELTKAEVEKIRDSKVKELVQKRMEKFDGNIKKAFGDSNNPLLHLDGKTPIEAVRLVENFNPETLYGIEDANGHVYKFYKYGNNHHVEIVKNSETGRWEGIFVTTMEAARRARREKTTVVNRDHGPEWEFIMSLCINDMIEIEQDGKKVYYRVQLLDASNQNIWFRLHNAATLEEKETRLIKRTSTLKELNPRKIAVDSLGDISDCND